MNDLGTLCDAIREAGLDPIDVLRDGGVPAREAAARLRSEGRALRLAAALDAFGEGLAIDHEAYKMPTNTPERVAEHGRARDRYAAAYAALWATDAPR